MCMLRSISIINLLKEFDYHNSIDNCSLSSIDILSVATITRCILESYCNFNNIYIQSKNENELILKYELWVVAGLKNRQSHNPVRLDFKTKKEFEAKQIKDIIYSIRSNEVYLSLNEDGKRNIEKAIQDKKWQVQIVGNTGNIIGWQKLLSNSGANESLDHLYTILSWNTHPSNLSVSQFAEAYFKNTIHENARITLEMATLLLSFFIHDYCKYFPEVQEFFLNAPTITKELIKFHNSAFRGIMNN